MPTSLIAKERAVKYLDIVRVEFQQRVELKQHVLNAYILGLAALLAFVIQGYKRIPNTCRSCGLCLHFRFASLYADHMLVSTSLSKYIRDELEPYLVDEDCRIPFWDRSPSVSKSYGIFGLLTLSEVLLTCLPIIGSLCVLWYHLYSDWSNLSLVGKAIDVGLSCYGITSLVLSLVFIQEIRSESRSVFGHHPVPWNIKGSRRSRSRTGDSR